MDKNVTIHLWIGNNSSSNEEYQQYFEQVFVIPDSFFNNKPSCEFCADIGEHSYIDGKLVLPERFSSPQDLNLIIDKIEVNESEKERILEQCTKLGITEANAVFWYINNDHILDIKVQEPYKESYNGLKYIGEFNADQKYDSEDIEIHTEDYLWIGTNFEPVEEYEKYFELDYVAEGLDDPDYKVCGFCKDTGNRWYDEDFIGYPKPLKEEVSVGELIDKLFYPELESKQDIIDRCKELGITKANALFWYTANKEYDDFQVKTPIKDNYNGLKYIGVFSLD